MALFLRCLKLQYVGNMYALAQTGRFSYSVYKSIKHDNLLVRAISTSTIYSKKGKPAVKQNIIEYPSKSKGETIGIWHNITAGELAQVFKKDFNYVKELFLGEIRSPDTVISDIKQLKQAVGRSGNRMVFIANPNQQIAEKTVEDAKPRSPPPKSALRPRPPVVTVMGHVDHGKTTLLDALRHTNVVASESGGITQHIGAFSVVLDNGSRVTFLDTPGHAAFSAMRARGANITDIVVLVVAADDGVMEQTLESIRMAREASVPLLIAINKIDAPNADIERTERMLLDIGICIEKHGGDVQAIPVSALRRQNLDRLVEALVLQAELMEIGADPTGAVEAVVVESRVDPHRGKIATIVVKRGCLERGDILVAGTVMGRVRALRDADGKTLKRVEPGFPAEVDGWRDLPSAGDVVLEVENERRAREVTSLRCQMLNQQKSEEDLKVIEEKAAHHRREYEEKLQMKRKLGRFKLRPDGPRKPEIVDGDDSPRINLVIKADVNGTLEAVLDTLDTYDYDDCKMDLVHYGVGPITENDIELAKTFNAIIYTFNVDCSEKMGQLAKKENVEVKYHNIIYKLVDDVKEEINKRLPPTEAEDVLGEATVLQQFEINDKRKKVPVAGCRCVKGFLRRSAKYKLIRNEQVIYDGSISTMKHLKNDVDTIKTDMECGLQLGDKTIAFQAGDIIVCYQMKTVQQVTKWNPGF